MPEKLEQELPDEVTADFGAVVGRVSAAVLETMFFEEAVESECDHAWLADAVSAHLNFDGSHSGEFLLAVSPAAARGIAAGFLGQDAEELTAEQIGQVILELANILCGSVMSNLWPESSLSLEPPELVAAGPGLPASMHRCFQLPDGPVSVSLLLRQGPESS